MNEHDDPSPFVNRIIGATAEHLIIEVDGNHRPLAWTTVESVYATIATQGDSMLIMAFEIREGRTPRSLIVAQIDAVWVELQAALHIGLPEALPIEMWEQALVDMPMVLPVFRRGTLR